MKSKKTNRTKSSYSKIQLHNSIKKEEVKVGEQIILSLLDITYPYYNQSMLAKSKFFGIECLMFLLSIYFSIMYVSINYVNKGYFLKWHILEIVSNNLITDIQLILCFICLGFIWVYTGYIMVKSKIIIKKLNIQKIFYIYCITWGIIFVSFALFVINSNRFYFTDRIFIVVVSWSLAFKNSSCCLDLLQVEFSENVETELQEIKNKGKLGLLYLYIKFIISPMIIFKEFIKNHNVNLKIHLSYLLIKFLVAFFFLAINYILMTQFIQPFLQPTIHNEMLFIQLFFKLIPYHFYIHVCLYYIILQNILPAMAELTQLRNRQSYLDWWNAETISEFLDKWVLQINSFSNAYLTSLSKKIKHSINLTLIIIMIFNVFEEKINLKIVLFTFIHISLVYLLGQIKSIQNNYIVHFLTISFPSFWLAVELKYKIFD